VRSSCRRSRCIGWRSSAPSFGEGPRAVLRGGASKSRGSPHRNSHAARLGPLSGGGEERGPYRGSSPILTYRGRGRPDHWSRIRPNQHHALHVEQLGAAGVWAELVSVGHRYLIGGRGARSAEVETRGSETAGHRVSGLGSPNTLRLSRASCSVLVPTPGPGRCSNRVFRERHQNPVLLATKPPNIGRLTLRALDLRFSRFRSRAHLRLRDI